MAIRFVALEQCAGEATGRTAVSDANGQPPERAISDGNGIPCRFTLAMIPKPASPTSSWRTARFLSPQPYAEVGPIFVHAEAASSARRRNSDAIPAFLESPRYIVRGYDATDRIVYGTGQIVATPEIPAAAIRLFKNEAVRYLHIRSATNNCYHCRIDRA